MQDRKSLYSRSCIFFGVHYLILLLVFMVFTGTYGYPGGFWQGLWMTIATLTYPIIYLLPGAGATWLLLLSGRRGMHLAAAAVAVAWTSFLELLLVVDMVVLHNWGYHINGLVINLMFTPGGFSAMGLDAATIIPSCLLVLAFLALNILLAVATCKWRRLDPALEAMRKIRPWKTWTACALAVALFVSSLFIQGVSDFFRRKEVLSATASYPVTFTIRIRRFMKKLGFTQPPREDTPFDDESDRVSALNYPERPIQRETPETPLNIIWLTSESLRADHLNARTMPNAWRLAGQGVHATDHYSGGHGTRNAMFSMFYGLYGNNWNSFLNAKRGPLLFDWLREDGYLFNVQTSARFTYPEFDQTIFASIPSGDMKEMDDSAPSWVRDVKAVDRILGFLEARAADGKPFFCFQFFEGTHAPYNFDPERPLIKEYMPKINYATVSDEDAQLLYNRQVNAAHDIDRQIGRILDFLEKHPEVKERTIIVINGDHGEEFYEKGRLGHNSTFVDEQLKTPLVITIPGVEYRTVAHRTHHTDIIPTIAPFLGVKNPPKDYSVGESILDDGYDRQFYVSCGWKLDCFITRDYKYILPTGTGAKYYGRNLSTGDDKPLGDDGEFLRRYAKMLVQANHDMMRFVKKGK